MFRRDQKTIPCVCFLVFALFLVSFSLDTRTASAQTYDFDEGMRALTSGLLAKKQDVLKGRKIAVFGIVEGNTGEEWRITSYIEDEIVTVLVNEGYRVVERSRIDDVLKKEIKKGADLWFDEAQAARFGKLLGADAVVTGKYTQWGNNTLRVNVRCISVADGEVLAGSRVNVLTDRIQGLLKKDDAGEEKASADRNSQEEASDRQVERIKKPIEVSDFTENNQRRPIEVVKLGNGGQPPPPGNPVFDPNRVYRLVAKHSGRVLDVNLPDRDQANVVQNTWHGGDNQRWRIEVVE